MTLSKSLIARCLTTVTNQPYIRFERQCPGYVRKIPVFWEILTAMTEDDNINKVSEAFEQKQSAEITLNEDNKIFIEEYKNKWYAKLQTKGDRYMNMNSEEWLQFLTHKEDVLEHLAKRGGTFIKIEKCDKTAQTGDQIEKMGS